MKAILQKATPIWELARLHTRESWLAWYPAIWGACVAAGTQNVSLGAFQFMRILFGIWISVTATHCTFCTFNDIVDQDLDKHVDRCKTRPLPAGLISTRGAVLAFISWLVFTVLITHITLGNAVVFSFFPVWVLSATYPFMKRLIPFPQVVLGIIVGAAVFPGWVSITNRMPDSLKALSPLFVATACWVVYFDTFYATQDSADDEKIGVQSLAVALGGNLKVLLGALGLLQIVFFALTAISARLSVIFWLLGWMPWSASIPWHILSLDVKDRQSGGRIFRANIKLGLYMTGVTLLELSCTRVFISSSAKLP